MRYRITPMQRSCWRGRNRRAMLKPLSLLTQDWEWCRRNSQRKVTNKLRREYAEFVRTHAVSWHHGSSTP